VYTSRFIGYVVWRVAIAVPYLNASRQRHADYLHSLGGVQERQISPHEAQSYQPRPPSNVTHAPLVALRTNSDPSRRDKRVARDSIFDVNVHLDPRSSKAGPNSPIALPTSHRKAYSNMDEYGRLREIIRQCHEHAPKLSEHARALVRALTLHIPMRHHTDGM